VQRKVLTPNDFTGLNQLAERWLDFQYYWEATAKPSNGSSPKPISRPSSPNCPPTKSRLFDWPIIR
jgi:hypothetical protein